MAALRSVTATIGRVSSPRDRRGPSDPGKSTMLAIVAHLVRLTTGSGPEWPGLLVDGPPDKALSGVRAGRRSGLVFQQFFLVPDADRAWTAVATGLLYRGTAARERRAAAADGACWPRSACPAGLCCNRPAELSMAKCQRVAIARALAGRPAISSWPTRADRRPGLGDQRGHPHPRWPSRTAAGRILVGLHAQSGDRCRRQAG